MVSPRSVRMDMYVAGFNPHGQLSSHSKKEILSPFEHSWEHGGFRLVCSFWSVTVFEKNDRFHLFGYVSEETWRPTVISKLPVSKTAKIFGDISGVRGALDKDGYLYETSFVSRDGDDNLEPVKHQLDFKIKGTVSAATSFFR